MDEDKRKVVIEKLKTYLDEKLELAKDESYIILSILAKDYLEEMTEEEFDLDDDLDVDDDLDDDEQPEDEAAEDIDETENKEKTLIKKPKIEVKGATETKQGEKDAL